jgi:hypothetical protein
MARIFYLTHTITSTDNAANRIYLTDYIREVNPEGDLNLIDFIEIGISGVYNLVQDVNYILEVNETEVYIEFLGALIDVDKTDDSLYFRFLVPPQRMRVFSKSHIVTTEENQTNLIDITSIMRDDVPTGTIYPDSVYIDFIEVGIAGAPSMTRGDAYVFVYENNGVDPESLKIQFIGVFSNFDFEGESLYFTYSVNAAASGLEGGSFIDAPFDDQVYGRKNGEWVLIGGGTGEGIPEAPINDTKYVRENGEWVPLPEIQVSGDAVNGGVFPTNITGSGGSNIAINSYTVGGVIKSITIDGSNYTLSVMAITGHTDLKPAITVVFLGAEDEILPTPAIHISNLSASANERTVFDGSVALNIPPEAFKIRLTHPDGAWFTINIEREVAPIIHTARFDGNYPNNPLGQPQTEVKAGDAFGFYIETDTPITEIQFDNYGAFNSQGFTVSEGVTHTLSAVTIANRGTSSTKQGAMIRVKKASGSTSEWFILDNTTGVDKTDFIWLNNTYPSINFSGVNYPTTPFAQTALKNTESAVVNHTITNGDHYTYSSPNTQLSITNSTVYEPAKTVSRIGGDYNVSTNNFRVLVTKASNGAQSTGNTRVNIAHTTPIITVSLPNARLRSGGNDGTSTPSYAVNVTSNQQMYINPRIDTASKGVLSTSPGSQTLQIHDNLQKGSGELSSFYGVNLAGIEVTEFTAGSNVTGGTSDKLYYVVGGFLSRSFVLPAFGTTVTINTAVDTLSKVRLGWSFKSNMDTNASAIGTPPPKDGGWTVSAVGSSPTDLIILDTQAANASTQDSTLTVEEII